MGVGVAQRRRFLPWGFRQPEGLLVRIFISGVCASTNVILSIYTWNLDAIAFHFYGTDPRAFVEYATTLHETYNKPIWITEFADQVGS